MVEYIWAFLIIIGIIFSFLSGNIDVINKTILGSASKGFELLMTIIPIVILWTGIMRIAEESGLLKKFANFMAPLLNRLFPSVPKNNPALGYIASNIAANMLGLGSAATPFGLKEIGRAHV